MVVHPCVLCAVKVNNNDTDKCEYGINGIKNSCALAVNAELAALHARLAP